MGTRLFTSESVSRGHPDKVCDQVADGILDACLASDPNSRVACEVLCTTDYLLLAGEITTTANVDFEAVARNVLRDIGYTRDDIGFDAQTCQVDVRIHSQSSDIAQGVNPGGAGDQGLMFGYACDQTEELMPLPIALAHRIVNRLAEVREQGTVTWLRPDGKSQVTVEFNAARPVRVPVIVVSTQHAESVSNADLRDFVIGEVIRPSIPEELLTDETTYHINPTGRFVTGGPHGDTGLTGRKIIVDTYGGWAPHGGGAFSGKDPTKVDRSAAYMARYIAKNVVAAGLAKECEIQLAYAIGVAEPISARVDTRGTATVPESDIERLIRERFPLTPAGIIQFLDLRRPIFRKTAAGGHFGRSDSDFTWEATSRSGELREMARRSPSTRAAAGSAAT